MDLPQLRCFLAVAEELHFGKAAMRLHITPSPVSRMIKSLERELGADLFVRRYHDVQLTPLGEELLGRTRTIVADVDRLTSVAAAFVSRNRILRVGTTYLAPPALSERLIEIAEESVAPGSVDVIVGQSSVLIPDVVIGAIDLALVHLPVNNMELDHMAVSRYKFVVAMRADDPLADHEELELSDLVDRTLTIQPVTPQPLAVNRFHQQLAEAGITRFHRMADYDVVQLAAHIRRHHGLTLVPHPSNGGAPSVFLHPAFTVVPLRGDSPQFEVGIVWNKDKITNDNALQKLISTLRDEWKEVQEA